MPTTQQQQAIEKDSGPCIVLAGAGTGKTHTIVEKINHLVNVVKKYRPDEILCLTFSNGATNSLRKKVQEKLGAVTSVNVKTFHSFCADILKEDGHLVHIDEGFQILLPDDAKILLHKHLGITPYWSNRYIMTIHSAKDFGISLGQIEGFCDDIKGKLLGYCTEDELEGYAEEQRIRLSTLHLLPQETVEQRRAIKEQKKEISAFIRIYDEYKRFVEFIDVWKKYEGLKTEKNLLDFSDLNRHVLDLLRQFGSEKYAALYKYVFVDEFQDTNMVQFELIEFFATHRNITVVGDPNQSVYGFRGSYKKSFDRFKRSFEVNDDTDVFRLDKSYRSPNTVLNVAHCLIKNNYEDESDCLLVENADGREGDKVKVVELVNADEEARYIAELVEKAIDKGTKKSDICILFRTHKQSQVIRRALELKSIPVIASGKTNMMQRREIRTAVAYLSILSNIVERSGTGEQAWWDLFHYHNTLSPADSVKIGRYLKGRRDVSIDEALLALVDEVDMTDDAKRIVGHVARKLHELQDVSNKALPDLVLDVYEISGLNRAFTYERTVENIECLLNLKKFHEIATNFYEMHDRRLAEFIRHIEIIDLLGVDINSSQVMQVDAVNLMTIHAAKGLEYELVIVSNMAEGRFPVTRTRNEPLIPKELHPDLAAEIASWGEIDDDEKARRIRQYDDEILLYEERRLAYVAWTRAKAGLVLTYARSYNGKPDSNGESLFLKEIDYKENSDCDMVLDIDETSAVIAPSSEYEQYKSLMKEQLVNSLDTDDFRSIVDRLMVYVVCRDRAIGDFGMPVNKPELERHLLRCVENRSSLVFSPDAITFSPTGLMTYDECHLKFELSQILRMPERGAFELNGASIGTFLHKLFEVGVSNGFDTKDKYVEEASRMIETPLWDGVRIDDVRGLIDVFWERNKDKYDSESMTEVALPVVIDGFRFFGFADRVDKLSDGTVEVIDYKTNTAVISPKKRAWQLGFYALALQSMGYKVSKLTLDMLRLDSPVEMMVDETGNVTNNGRGQGFTLEGVKGELLEAVRGIAHDFEHSFAPAEDENGCRFCGYKFYCPKWDE
ncbi:MAG: ATP-dependent DNA helicase [archaeon]